MEGWSPGEEARVKGIGGELPMATERIKLASVQLRNYLGSGDDPASLELDGQLAVLCGPNNSGKSTVLKGLETLKAVSQVFWAASSGESQVQVTWVGDGNASPEIFHWGKQTCNLSATFLVPHSTQIPPSMVRIGGMLQALDMTAADPIRIRFDVSLQAGRKLLDGVWFEGHKVFDPNGGTIAFDVKSGWQTARNGQLFHIVNLPRFLVERIWYFPSLRFVRQGNANDLSSLAAGAGIVDWVRSARNPNARDLSQRRAADMLREFEKQFSEFADLKKLELTVPENGTEINAWINDHLRPLSNLGSGIGEALLITLAAKIGHSAAGSLDVFLLEEPEIHLHPALQRRLLDQLARYGVQIIATTHSPTVVNWFARNGQRVFRTEFETGAERIVVQPVEGLPQLRGLMESIGVSPADLLLADKVLLVEGANDVPVFKAWCSKAPSLSGQNVAILSLGGSDAASSNFDPEQIRNLHPKMHAIIDSERVSAAAEPAPERHKIKNRLEVVGIPCHLTELRATESYFTARALRSVYSASPDKLDPFGDPNLSAQGVKQFTKSRNAEVARAMEWAELQNTDIAKHLEEFLKS